MILNAFEFTDGYVDILGIATGQPHWQGSMLFPDIYDVNPSMTNLAYMIKENQRFSFVYKGNALALDHIIVSNIAMPYVLDFQYIAGNSGSPESESSNDQTAWASSDHDAVVVGLSDIEQEESSIEFAKLLELPGNRLEVLWQPGYYPIKDVQHYNIEITDTNLKESIGWTGSQTGHIFQLNQAWENIHITIQPSFNDGSFGAIISTDFVLTSPQTWTYRFPHIAHNSQWWTGMVVLNSGDLATSLNWKSYDQTGLLMAENQEETDLEPGGKRVGLVSDFLAVPGQWVELTSDQPLLGFELFGQGFDLMSGIPVSASTGKSGMLPFSESVDDQYAAVSFLNPDMVNSATIEFSAYNEIGAKIGVGNKILSPREKSAELIPNLFSVQLLEKIKWVTWTSNQNITSFLLWGDLNWQWQNGVGQREKSFVESIVPLWEVGSSLEIYNSSQGLNNIKIEWLTNTGTKVYEMSRVLLSNEKMHLVHPVLLDNFDYGFLKITSSQGIWLEADLQRLQNGDLLSEAIPGHGEFGELLIAPHIASNNQWSTEIAMVNTGNSDAILLWSGLDKQGDVVEEKIILLSSHQSKRIKIRENFDQFQSIHSIRIFSANAKLAGHMMYYTNPGIGQILGGTALRPIN